MNRMTATSLSLVYFAKPQQGSLFNKSKPFDFLLTRYGVLHFLLCQRKQIIKDSAADKTALCEKPFEK